MFILPNVGSTHVAGLKFTHCKVINSQIIVVQFMYNQHCLFVKNQNNDDNAIFCSPLAILKLPSQSSLHKRTSCPAVRNCSQSACHWISPADTDHRLDWWWRSSCCWWLAFPQIQSEPEVLAVKHRMASVEFRMLTRYIYYLVTTWQRFLPPVLLFPPFKVNVQFLPADY